MKKYISLLIIILSIPAYSFSFSVFGDPVKLPDNKEFIVYAKQPAGTKHNIQDSNTADIDTTLLVYNIKQQISKSTSMYYFKNGQVHIFKNSQWTGSISQMTTVALFQYLLNQNIVTRLAYEDINVRQNFTLSGTTAYGPILDADNNKFTFYMTFYLTDEAHNDIGIKTIKYEKNITNADITPERYAELTNDGLTYILTNLKPWLSDQLKTFKIIDFSKKVKRYS